MNLTQPNMTQPNMTQPNLAAISNLLKYIPKDWIELTTHRLDIYDEGQAKSQFLRQLQTIPIDSIQSSQPLADLPTAYDYIRLGHQLSSVLEWLLAGINQVSAEQVISFSSKTMPILAILRKNKLSGKRTKIYYNTQSLPLSDSSRLTEIYGYQFELIAIDNAADIVPCENATVLLVTESVFRQPLNDNPAIVATINIHQDFGSVITVHGDESEASVQALVKEIQHVRRRESIAMTPPNTFKLLEEIVHDKTGEAEPLAAEAVATVNDCIKANTGTRVTPLIASSGLSIQYAIMMGVIEAALTEHPGKPVKIILPPNCYGGTNDQARRVAALVPNAEIIDLLVDGGQELVSSLEMALEQVAKQNGVPIVLAEIPTNPRVEVPNMAELGRVLGRQRQTPEKTAAVAPTFLVDQTFCPNVKLLDQASPLAGVKVISFSSGSKFPSGGRCIAGYCTSNEEAKDVQKLVEKHLVLSDNRAVAHQLNTLAEFMPSMPERIQKAYENTVSLVSHIKNILPAAKMNFVSAELAAQGFTPSVFSLDLPTKGDHKAAREAYKRALNEKLINFMITRHPSMCKYCVSYGQLKGSYWTIPATSTQGTTKEDDKDYIVRVALSPDVDIAALQATLTEFCEAEF